MDNYKVDIQAEQFSSFKTVSLALQTVQQHYRSAMGAQDLANYITYNVTCMVQVQWHLYSVGNSSFHRVELPRYEHSGNKRHCSHKIERFMQKPRL